MPTYEFPIAWDCMERARPDVPYNMRYFNQAYQAAPMQTIFEDWYRDLGSVDQNDPASHHPHLLSYAQSLGCAQMPNTGPAPTPTPIPVPGSVSGDTSPLPGKKPGQYGGVVQWVQDNPFIAIGLVVGAAYFLIGKPTGISFGSAQAQYK